MFGKLLGSLLLFLIYSFPVCADVHTESPGIVIGDFDGTNAGRYRSLKFPNGSTTNNHDGSVSVGTGGGGSSGITITSFTNNKNSLENGTVVTSTLLSWTTSATPTSLSLDNGIGSISAALTNYTHTDTYSTNRTYVLTASDGMATPTASTSITFFNSNYYGVNSSTTLNDSQINALTQSLASNGIFTINHLVSSAQYIYVAYPASYGPAFFLVNGLLNNDWNLSVQSHTNASGASVSYNVYRTNNLLTGTYNVAVSQ